MGQYVTLHGEVISHVNLSRTEVGDGGLYTCTATNRAGSAAHSARLNIYGECRHYWSLVTCVLQFHQYLQLGWARLNPPDLIQSGVSGDRGCMISKNFIYFPRSRNLES